MKSLLCFSVILLLTINGLAQQPMTPNPNVPPSAATQPTGSSLVTDDTVVLRAGNFALTKSQYERLVAGFDRNSGALATGPTANSVTSGEDVARLLALVSEAQRRGIDKDPKIEALLQVRGYVMLANALLASLRQDMKKDEATTIALYKSEQHGYVQIKARQILIRYDGVKSDSPSAKGMNRSEADAKEMAQALYAKLKGGADFAALAKSDSDDETTAAKGGELPVFTRGAMTTDFETVAFNTPVGRFSEPFKTKYGYHIVEIVEHPPVNYERVRPALEDIRARQAWEQIGSSGVELNPAYFQK